MGRLVSRLLRDRPSNHAAAAQVGHARQIQPPFVGRNAGDVRCPRCVRPLHRPLELPGPVGGHGLLVVALRGARPAAAPSEPGHPVPAAGVPRPARHPGADAGCRRCAEVARRARRSPPSGRCRRAPARSAPVDAKKRSPRATPVERRAESTDRRGVFPVLDHGKTLPFGPAKSPTDFPKMSRWLVTLWSWARSRRTSACSSWAVGARAGSLPSAAVDGMACAPPAGRHHARRLSVVRPSPSATRLAGTTLFAMAPPPPA